MKLFKLLTVGAFLLAGAVTYAQDPSNRSMSPSFGVKGGVNFANITGDDFNDADGRTSFHVGVLAEFPLAEIFSLQVEALYSGQGWKRNYDIPFIGEEELEYQLDYINVPVLAKVYVLEGLSIEVGPQFSFKVNEEFDNAPEDDGGDYDLDEAESFEFGVAAGLTFQTKMGLFATGRYTQGMTDVVKDVDAKNQVWQIGIGYKF